MAYRTSQMPPPPPVVRVVVGRTWFATIVLAIVAVIAFGVGWLFGGGVRVTCRRAAGTCAVDHLVGPGTIERRETLPIASIERATLERNRGEDGLSGIALVYGGEPHLLAGTSGGSLVSEKKKEEWVASMNAFLFDPNQPSVDEPYTTPEVFWIACLFALLAAGFGVIAARGTVVVVDRASHSLVVVHGTPRSREAFDLRDVVASRAEPRQQGLAVVLERRAGASLELPGLAHAGNDEIVVVATHIARAISGD